MVRSGGSARPRRPRRSVTAALLLVSAACGTGEAGEGVGGVVAATAQSRRRALESSHVDSILPIEESLRRFRDALGPEPDSLEGGARTRDELVDGFLRALAARDTAALARMLLSAEEFAWLYYPHTRYTAPPYTQAPQLVWFQIRNGSSRGLGRQLARVGGSGIAARGYDCPPAPRSEGSNRMWEACLVSVRAADGRIVERRLFGPILERDGVFKFVSYANDY